MKLVRKPARRTHACFRSAWTTAWRPPATVWLGHLFWCNILMMSSPFLSAPLLIG